MCVKVSRPLLPRKGPNSRSGHFLEFCCHLAREIRLEPTIFILNRSRRSALADKVASCVSCAGTVMMWGSYL